MMKMRIMLGVFSLAFFIGQAAEAQLFPNLWIRRVRPDCETESPMIKMNRDNYYGYHPTEWTRFPSGWGIIHPEVINREELMSQVNEEVKKLDEEFGPKSGDREEDDDLPPRGGRQRDKEEAEEGDAVPRPVPLPSMTDSPFNLDDKAAQPENKPAVPGRGTTPGAPELPKPGDSPFDLPSDKPAAPSNDEIPPRPKATSNLRTGADNEVVNTSSEIAVIEAPPEVMRAPERNSVRDFLGNLNPRSWRRR